MQLRTITTLFLTLSCKVTFGQDTARLQEAYVVVRTVDRNIFYGRLLRADSTAVVLKTEVFPELSIPRQGIRRMKSIELDRFQSRTLPISSLPIAGSYALASSAYGIPAGEGYFANTLLFISQLGVGFSDHFSLRANLFFDFEEFFFPSLIIPKVSFPMRDNRLAIAFEGIFGRGLDNFTEDGSSNLIAFQGLVTVGSRMNHLTGGVGLGNTNRRWGYRPLFSASGSVQIGERWCLLTENYFLHMYGEPSHIGNVFARLYDHSVNFDFGLLANFYEEIVLPFVGLSVNLH